MPNLADLPVFGSLSMPLSEWMAAWITECRRAQPTPTPEEVYTQLSQSIGDEWGPVRALAPPERHALARWLQRAPVRQVVDAIGRAAPAALDQVLPVEQLGPELETTRPLYKPATPEQLRIIREIQRESSVDFGRYFAQLTAWEADIVIKGCAVVSEVLRTTGDRHFPLGSLRCAVREFLRRSFRSTA